jgi:hypothetical protein
MYWVHSTYCALLGNRILSVWNQLGTHRSREFGSSRSVPSSAPQRNSKAKLDQWVALSSNGKLGLTENPSAAAELGFDVEGVEAFMPLAPKCALYMPCVSVSQQILSGYEDAQRMLGNPRIACYRLHVLELSRRVSRDAKPLYDALTTGDPLTATGKNVENLNYLQCYWAHAAIYSNRRDFTFAKHVFCRLPQYRKTPKVSVRRGVMLIPC